jgi:hypothetical protein
MLNILSHVGSANQDHAEKQQLGWLVFVSQIATVGKDVEKLEPLYAADSNIKW